MSLKNQRFFFHSLWKSTKSPFVIPSDEGKRNLDFSVLSSHAFGRLTCYPPPNLLTSREQSSVVGTWQAPSKDLFFVRDDLRRRKHKYMPIRSLYLNEDIQNIFIGTGSFIHDMCGSRKPKCRPGSTRVLEVQKHRVLDFFLKFP